MLYMDCDNDLEAPQLENLKEILETGSSREVNLVALVDRNPAGEPEDQYFNGPIANLRDWTTAKLLHVEKGNLRELEDWGEVDMGDPAVLQRFIRGAAKAYPASRYGLIFADHGQGWSGICTDASHDDDLLTTAELRSALQAVLPQTGKLELLGFDACQMANLETAAAVAPFAQVMVASEELEPTDGWSYTPALRALQQDPGMSGLDLGRRIVETYRDFYVHSEEEQTRHEGMGITLSVVDLERVAALESAVDTLADRCQADIAARGRAAWLPVASARAQAEEYGKSGDEDSVSMRDLLDLARLLQQRSPGSGVAGAAGTVAAALRQAVAFRIRGKARPGASGLSIFFPRDREELDRKDPVAYAETAFARNGHWGRFLASYAAAAAADHTAPELEPVRTSDPTLLPHRTATITGRVEADDVDTVDFVFAMEQGSEQVILGQRPARVGPKGRLSEPWDGQWFTLGDGKTHLVCPISDMERVEPDGDAYYAEVRAQIRARGEKRWKDVTLYFYLDYRREHVAGELVSVEEDTDDGDLEIRLEKGDLIRPLYRKIDSKGEEKWVTSQDPGEALKAGSSGDLTVGMREVRPGKYYLGFVVSDFAGNVDEKYVGIDVK